MSSTDNSNALTWVLGGALLLIGLFVVVLLVSVNSQADSISTSAGVTNVAPVVDTVDVKQGGASKVGSTIALSSGTVATVTVEGQITDNNGVNTNFANGDLSKVEAILYRSGQTCTIGGATDANYCYAESSTDTSCTITATSAIAVNYTCTFDAVQFYADSTSTGGTDPTGNWKATVRATDDATASDDTDSGNTDIATLLSVNIPSTIAYGTLALAGSTTNSNNQEMILTQYGNDQADVEVSSAAAMNCTVGTIPVANQKWSLTDLSYVATAGTGITALGGSPADTNVAVGYMTVDGTPVTKILYWNILLPTTGVSGSCTGTTTISAIAA